MSWQQSFPIFLQPPDQRPVGAIEEEILDELQFHIEMRTLDNISAGMSPDEARQNALSRFGDFETIHKACRKTLIGERIMLQRVQAVLTLVLLGAVVFLGVQLYRGQQANEAAMARLMETNEAAAARMLQTVNQLAAKSPAPLDGDSPSVVETVPKTGDRNVDPSLTEIRVTYDRQMALDSWSWCGDPAHGYPKTTGDPHYEADGKTCVLPVRLEPGKRYTIQLNCRDYRNFRDASGRSAIPYAGIQHAAIGGAVAM